MIATADAYAQHMKEFEVLMNQGLKQHRFLKGIRSKFVPIPTMVYERCHREFESHGGRLFQSQIETVLDIANRCLSYDSHSLSGKRSMGILYGAMQGGKSYTAAACRNLATMLHLKTGLRHQVIILVPNSKSLQEQMVSDLRSFNSFYRGVEFSSSGSTISLNEDKVQTDILLDGEIDYDCMVYRRTMQDSDFEKMLISLYQARVVPIIFVDECHWGESIDSSMDVLLNLIVEIEKKHAKPENMGRTVIINSSATPFTHDAVKRSNDEFARQAAEERLASAKNFEIWTVNHRLGPNYLGPNFFNGRPLDDRYESLRPELIRFSEVRRRFGIDFDHMDQARYKKNDSDIYRDEFESTVVKLIHAVLKERPGGITIRLPKNESVDSFIARNGSKIKKDIALLPRIAENSSVTVEEFIKEKSQGKENYVLFVTGTARMGDRFPGSCRTFVEFSKSENVQAISQGLYGRACGYNKETPLLLFPDSSAKFFNGYLATDGSHRKLPKAPSPNTKMFRDDLFEYKPGTMGILIKVDKLQKLLSPARMKAMEDWVARVNRFRGDLRGGTVAMSEHRQFFADILSPETFDEIEKNAEMPGMLLRYSPKVSDRKKVPYIDATDSPYDDTVSFRAVGEIANSAQKNSNKGSDAKGNRIQLRISKTEKGRGEYLWKIQALRLRLVRPLDDNPGSDRTVLAREDKSSAYRQYSHKPINE